MQVAVSFINSDYGIKDTINRIDKTNCDYLHVDLMDGKFVKNKNFTYSDIVSFVKDTNKKIDLHLMCNNPLKDMDKFANLNLEYVTFHYEASKEIDLIIDSLRNYGIKVGISIKPKTSIKKIIPYLNKVDMVLVMSVNPGKGGQEFIPETKDRIEELCLIKKDNNYNYIISVDGGINDDSIKYCCDADMVVVGSYICKSKNYQLQIDNLKNKIK